MRGVEAMWLYFFGKIGPTSHMQLMAYGGVLEEVAATSTKLGTVRYTRGRARVAPAAL